MEDVDDTDERKLYNLAYFGASTEERLALFQADYGNTLDDVHETGADKAVSDSALAANDEDDSDNPYGSEDSDNPYGSEDDEEDELA